MPRKRPKKHRLRCSCGRPARKCILGSYGHKYRLPFRDRKRLVDYRTLSRELEDLGWAMLDLK